MKKILIADDDQNFTNALKTELELSGFEVLIAQSGDEAITKTTAELPDLVLLDIILPEKTGLTVLETLKKERETRSIPVIAISNFGGADNQRRIIKLGADLFIPKYEYQIPQIVQAVEKIIGKP